MSWPSTVSPGQSATANQYNAVVANLQAWGGDVDAAGHILKNVGGLVLGGAVTIDASTNPFSVLGGISITAPASSIALTAKSADLVNTLQISVLNTGGGAPSLITSTGTFAIKTTTAPARGLIVFCYAGQEEYLSSISGRLRVAVPLDLDSDLISGGKIQGASLTVTNAANIVLGANWVNWTPVVTPNAPLTVTSTSIEHAYYFRLGAIVFFSFGMVLQFGGSSSTGFAVSLPVAALDAFSHICSVLVFQGSLVQAATAQQTGSQVNVFTNVALALATATSVRIAGFYKVA